MSIKSQGGVFGRNPTFATLTVENGISVGSLTVGGEAITGLSYQGAWNANTNTPDITASPAQGQFWIVSVDGSTNVGGITNWTTGDWALYDGSNWQRVEGGNTDLSSGVTGQLAVTNGGTGASDAATALSNLGAATSAQGALADSALQPADIGVSVQGYDATILTSSDIGSTVQGYDADTAKYDDATANFAGTLQEGGNNVVTANEVGTIASQDSDSVDIDGGAIDGVTLAANDEVKLHGFRTASSTGIGNQNANYYKIGTWSNVGSGSRLVLKICGAAGFSNGAQSAGEATIALVRDNSGSGSGSDLEGCFWGMTAGALPAVKTVYWDYVSIGTYDIYILAGGGYTNIDPIGFTNNSVWTTSVSSTGSSSVPSGAVSISSQTMNLYVGATGDNNASTPIGFSKDGNIVLNGGVVYNETASGTIAASATVDILPPVGAGVFYISTFCTTLGYGSCYGSGTFGRNAGESYVTADGLAEFDAGFSHLTISSNAPYIRIVNNHPSRAHSYTIYYVGIM